MSDPIDTPLVFPPDPEYLGRVPRCLGCGYRLAGLSHTDCPECGRRFDPKEQTSYSWRRPFVWYRFWWPGVLLALGSGLLWSVFFYSLGALGWGMFIGLPFMLGTLLGYGGKVDRWFGPVVAPLLLVSTVLLLVVMLMAGGLAGVFCGITLLVFLIPIGLGGLFLGVLAARTLGSLLKQSAFSHREYLPLLVLFLLLPGIAHVAQVLFAPPIPVETVRTTRVLEVRPDAAWDAWLFYEEVEHRPPWLLRMGLPTPSHVEGRIVAVGDREVCVYTGDARLVKRATIVEPGRLLAFDVVGQHHFEDNSIRLINGSFAFEEVGAVGAVGTVGTKVTLTTRYEPLLRPRLLWRPIEHTVAHQLHGHVLEGMQRDVDARRYTDNGGLTR